jgi:hypothetical protein
MLIVSATIVFLQSFCALAHASATVDIQQVSGDSAQATFHSVDSTGCIVTDTFVSASVGEVHTPPGGPAEVHAASVGISQFDQCRGLLLMSAVGSTESDSFSFANDMSTASLTAMMPVDEFVSGTSFWVQVTIAWTGSGDSVHQVNNTHVRFPGFNAKTHFNGTSRQAQASGTVSDGQTNYTVGASIDVTDLEQTSVGQITVEHN